MYFDEDMVLDLRLNILNQYVKKFIIAESTYTHNGRIKELKFNINNFKNFKNKIEYIIIFIEAYTLPIEAIGHKLANKPNTAKV